MACSSPCSSFPQHSSCIKRCATESSPTFCRPVLPASAKPCGYSPAVCCSVSAFTLHAGELSWAADASHHIVSSWLAAQAIADGQVPIWTFFMGTGSPYLQNYGFAFFYLIGLVDIVCRDLFLSLKLVMAAAHVLSGIGMYYLAAQPVPLAPRCIYRWAGATCSVFGTLSTCSLWVVSRCRFFTRSYRGHSTG